MGVFCVFFFILFMLTVYFNCFTLFLATFAIYENKREEKPDESGIENSKNTEEKGTRTHVNSSEQEEIIFNSYPIYYLST